MVGMPVGAVLQVTPRFPPSAALGATIITEGVCTLDTATTHVPVDAFVAQENEPELADPHATSEGLAEVPTA